MSVKELQSTIKKPLVITGNGLHTGVACRMDILPAKANDGVKFQRTDLDENPIVRAHIDRVSGTLRCTSLTENGITINTVEHILAALYGLKIDNVLIQLNADEPPAMDGSSLPLVQSLLDAGILPQRKPRSVFELKTKLHIEHKGSFITAEPCHQLEIQVTIDHPGLGEQQAHYHSMNNFIDEVAPARTYCMLSDVKHLINLGLIKGGNLENAVLITDQDFQDKEIKAIQEKLGIEDSDSINQALRFQNEPARHKLLDLMGDLSLLGQQIKAKITSHKPGHLINTRLTKALHHQTSPLTISKAVLNA